MTDLKSFESLANHYQDGNISRMVKQALIVIPLYYYIKIKSGASTFEMSFDMWSQLKEADLFLPLLFIPHLICYYLVKEEFSNTNYDKKGKKYLDKATAIQRAAIWYGLWYGFFGWCLVFVLDLLIFLLSVISNI